MVPAWYVKLETFGGVGWKFPSRITVIIVIPMSLEVLKLSETGWADWHGGRKVKK